MMLYSPGCQQFNPFDVVLWLHGMRHFTYLNPIASLHLLYYWQMLLHTCVFDMFFQAFHRLTTAM